MFSDRFLPSIPQGWNRHPINDRNNIVALKLQWGSPTWDSLKQNLYVTCVIGREPFTPWHPTPPCTANASESARGKPDGGGDVSGDGELPRPRA